MVNLCAGLSPATLDAIADLERRVVAADGGRLKLEWKESGAQDAVRQLMGSPVKSKADRLEELAA